MPELNYEINWGDGYKKIDLPMQRVQILSPVNCADIYSRGWKFDWVGDIIFTGARSKIVFYIDFCAN